MPVVMGVTATRRRAAIMRARLWVALVIILPSCGQLDRSGTSTDIADGSHAVALTIGHRSEWRVLWLEGTTDLPNGAYVNYRVTHDIARTVPASDWPAANLVEAGRSAVQDGAYWAKINTLRWPAGTVRVLVQFPFPPQPPEVDARYGQFGEHLTGELVTVRHGMKAIEVEYEFEHSP